MIRDFYCAVREGFEPSVRFPVRMFSKHVLSATQAPHQTNGKCNKKIIHDFNLSSIKKTIYDTKN